MGRRKNITDIILILIGVAVLIIFSAASCSVVALLVNLLFILGIAVGVACLAAKFIDDLILGIMVSFVICELLLILLCLVLTPLVNEPDNPALALLPLAVIVVPLSTGIPVALLVTGSVRMAKRLQNTLRDKTEKDAVVYDKAM